MSVEVRQSDRDLFMALHPAIDDIRADVEAGAYDLLEDMQKIAAHRRQAEEAMRAKAADLLRKAIEDGYPTPADKTAQCEHGQFGWEECIACYDEQLLKTEAAIRGMEVE